MQENVISKIYIDGEFVTPHGTELADLFNPATGQVIGQVQLADEVDTAAAVAAAKRALPAWSATSKEERIAALRRLQAAVAAKRNEMLDSALVEYGAPLPRNEWMAGVTPIAVKDVSNPLTYPDLATAVRTQLSSGPARAAIQHSGLPAVRGALTRAFAGSRKPDGSCRQENVFRYLVGRT